MRLFSDRKQGSTFIILDFFGDGRVKDVERIERIITKLAICHAVYELSEGYKFLRWNGCPHRIWWKFEPQMTKDEINDYDGFEDLTDSLLPEVGSRVYDKVRALEMVLRQVDNPEQKIPVRQVCEQFTLPQADGESNVDDG